MSEATVFSGSGDRVGMTMLHPSESRPRLIGLVSLPFETLVSGKPGEAVHEVGSRLGIDEQGGAWLLVERWERLPPPEVPGAAGRAAMARVELVRWQRVSDMPFALLPELRVVSDRHARDFYGWHDQGPETIG